MKLKKSIYLIIAVGTIPLFAEAKYGEGGWVFGGVGLGAVMVNTSEVNPLGNQVNAGLGEVDKMGWSAHAKAGLSWYLHPNFVADAMLGYEYSKASGDAPAGGVKVDVEHRLGLFQLSPRYRFDENGVWQLGPVYKLAFGTDTNYSEREGQNFDSEPITHYLGLHLNYDIPSETEKTIYRLGVEALTDLSDKRDIYKLNLIFEIGFNLWGNDSPEAAPAEEIAAAPVEQDLMEPFEEVLPPVDENSIQTNIQDDLVMIRFPGDIFRFSTGMSHIESAETRKYLHDLGLFLSNNTEYWETANIVGHTDRRGPKGREREVNMELSNARAKTVHAALLRAGIDPNKMTYEGKGFDEPIAGAPDNAQGWKLNRRVELSLMGVSAPQEIETQIRALNKKYKK